MLHKTIFFIQKPHFSAHFFDFHHKLRTILAKIGYVKPMGYSFKNEFGLIF